MRFLINWVLCSVCFVSYVLCSVVVRLCRFSFIGGVSRAQLRDGSFLHFAANCSIQVSTIPVVNQNRHMLSPVGSNKTKPHLSAYVFTTGHILNIVQFYKNGLFVNYLDHTAQNHHRQKSFWLKVHRRFPVVSGSGGLDCVIIQQDRNYLYSYINF